MRLKSWLNYLFINWLEKNNKVTFAKYISLYKVLQNVQFD